MALIIIISKVVVKQLACEGKSEFSSPVFHSLLSENALLLFNFSKTPLTLFPFAMLFPLFNECPPPPFYQFSLPSN